MWCHHPFSQRNRIAERTVGVGIGGDRELGDGGGGCKMFYKGGRQYRASSGPSLGIKSVWLFDTALPFVNLKKKKEYHLNFD